MPLAAGIAARPEGRKNPSPELMRQLIAGKGFLFAEPGNVVRPRLGDPMRLYEVRCEF